MAEFTTANPFIPRASVVRFANSIFEARIHLPGAAAHVDVVPHQNFIIVTGSLATRVRADAEGKPSTLVFTDQPCGVFGRDIPVNLTAGTELVVLSAYQDCDDYVIRYTIRNSITPRANCADFANAAATGVNVPCGGGAGVATGAGICAGPGLFVRPCASVPPALLGRGAVAYAGPYGYGCAGYPAYNPGYPYSYGSAHGSRFDHPALGYAHGPVFHPNGGATF